MKVSIIMSVYNGERYLEECILSICSQDYKNFEFLILNDNSTDNTEKIIHKFMKYDSRIKYFKNKENLGLTKSLNKLIDYSTGELIARMDADDIALKDRLSQQVKVFKSKDNIDFVFTNATIIDKNSNNVCNSWMPKDCKTVIKKMPFFNYIMHPSIMVKKDVINKFGKYNENFVKGQDKELWLRLIENKINFYYLKEKLIKYRINPTSVRSKSKENYYYKLAKTCINNKDKIKALAYINNLSILEKIDIILRCMIPFYIYIQTIYIKNMFVENYKKVKY